MTTSDALFNCAICGCYCGAGGCALHPNASIIPERLADEAIDDERVYVCPTCGVEVSSLGCSLHPTVRPHVYPKSAQRPRGATPDAPPARPLVDASIPAAEALALLRKPDAPPATASVGPFKVGDRLHVVSGVRRLNLRARDVVTIERIEEMERREVRLRVARNGRHVATLYVRHVNRLSDAQFNANTGDPTESVRFEKWSTRMPASRLS